MYTCEVCHRSYQWEKSLLRHQRLECGKQPQFSCSLCQYRTKHKITFVGALTYPYRCVACNKTYSWEKSLRRHQRLECGKEPTYKCEHCAYRAKQKSSLFSHMLNRHKEHARAPSILHTPR
ncbi:hypothetical protein J6590_014877 [Homalodisca vitripennis]|nr:hypothetical protein J6590_014877 [Homalodisca vitripennis]